jgi:hypothetical protein
MTIPSAEIYLGFIALGFGVGAYGTLIGAGGGFVLMPLLLSLYPQEAPDKLTSISLAVVFLNALSGSEVYARIKRIDYKSGLIFGGATIPGAILGALHTAYVPRRLFDLVLAVLLIAGATLLVLRPDVAHILRIKRNPMHPHQMARHLVEADGKSFDYSFNPVVGIVLSLFVGYISSFLGIGGGIIHVPVLVYFLNFPVHIATATSHFILVIMSLTGTLTHVSTGAFSRGVDHMVPLAFGVVVGAQVGAHLSLVIRGKWIIRSLAVALGLVGVRILAMVF